MPELQPPKLHVPTPDVLARPAAAAPVRYVELHCKTNFSFLEGASHPDELAEQAARLGYGGMAVTDRNSLAGAVRAHVAARKFGLKLIVGAEITMIDAGPILLWAMNREGYGRLCRLLTRGRRQAPKGECRLGFADVALHSAGLLAGVLLPRADLARSELQRWRDVFGDRTYAVAELHRGPCDRRRLEEWDHAARAARAALGRGRRSLPRRQPALSSRRAHGHSLEDDRRRAGKCPLSQRRTTAAGDRRNRGAVRRVFRRRPAHRRSRRPR